ncbi:exportin ellipsoid body open [Arctopsyche grandis]|uniref:exportin ellipsoid body open n=1 Tax=Arctopsyche grandis TaxID=121162 RepID=UPI00406D8A56
MQAVASPLYNDASTDYLGTLEMLMAEFFSPTTQNERKKEIETMLQNFDRQQDSWKHCIYFMKKSSNQYVLMFALTTIENIINKKWSILTYPDKAELKNYLWEHFTHNHPKTPSFLRNKLAKLIVDIARHDWPAAYPNFFSQIVDLVETGGHTPVLGLVMVQALAEGLGTSSGSEQRLLYLPQERQKELQKLLLLYIPQLLTIITGVLDRLAQVQSIDNSFPNPPPSPERGPGNSSSMPTISGLPDLLASSSNTITRGGNQGSREECVRLCLVALQQLFSCLPHASNLPPTLISSVYHWASIVTQTEFDEDICIMGMSALNEILYQRHASVGCATLPRMTHETHRLLHHLVTPSHAPVLNNVSQMYIDKVSEFLQLFISLYFKRLDSEPEFDSRGFLVLLFQYTFQVPTYLNFLGCLDIWVQFLEILKPQDIVKYSDALLGLVGGIINKMQFQQNLMQLQQIDNDAINDDGETEWQIFLRSCVECVAKVAEFSPLHLFNLVLEIWHTLAEAHDNDVATNQELLDLASFTQLLGRLAPTLFQDKEDSSIEQNIKHAEIFLERLMKLLQNATNKCVNSQHQFKPVTNFHSQVHSGALACMGSWAHYIVRCPTTSCSAPLLLQTAAILLVNRDKQFPPVLVHASAHMLLSVTVSMRPAEPLQYIPDLYLQAQRSLNHLQFKTGSVVRQALCTMILECPMEASDSTSGSVDAKRLQACSSLVGGWCSSLMTPLPSSTPVQRLACLPSLTHLLRYFADHPTNAKKILAAAVEKPVHAALEVFQYSSHEANNYEENNVAPIVLEMFLALLHSLHQQLGNVFIRNSIHMFLDVAKRKQRGALQQLLCVLQVGVEGGSLANSTALEEVLTMCLEHILPLVQGNDTDTDVVYALFDLFGSILLNRWQHFYSSCVRQGWSPVGPEGAGDGAQTDHLSHFCAIMRAIISSFTCDNIEVARLNFRTMDFLNIRYKLYTKLAFQQELYGHTLGILLRILLQRTAVGTLLQEEVVTTCYNLAAIDFAAYFNTFLPSFLGTLQDLAANEIQELLTISKETDLPSFSQNLLRLTNDIRCYQMSRESTR